MKKVRVLDNSCGLDDYEIGEIIEMYSLDEIEEKETKGELCYGTLDYCRNSIELYKDRVLGFVLYETVDGKEDYVWVDSNEVEILNDEPKSTQTFKKSDLKTGDIIVLKNKEKYVFINELLGFVNISSNDHPMNEMRFRAFDEDLKHFRKVEYLEVIKVYRYNSSLEIDCDIRNINEEDLDIVFERKEYFTLKDAKALGNPFRHKDCTVYSHDELNVLESARLVTGRNIFELIEAKEYEVEE